MNFFLAKEFIRYFHVKTDEHSLHSPFFYHFYCNLIKNRSFSDEWESTELKRIDLLRNEDEIEIVDLGAGSKVAKSNHRKVKSIAKHSLSSPRFSQFLYNLIQANSCKNIIELGTSLGINTAYLSKANPESSILTFEADPNALKIAKEVNADQENIKFHNGDITDQLPEILKKNNVKIDLVYADANHTYDASIAYFNFVLPYVNDQSIYILDDIHWSAGMKKAWEELKTRDEVTSSIDLFDAGLLFFNPDFKKQHYVLDF